MIDEFKEFINKGNVLTAAVAFVMGLTFKPVIDVVVNRVVMPIIGLIFGTPNFDTLGTFACEEGEAAMAEGLINGCAGSLGAVITVLINFLLVAFVLFLIIKAYNKSQRAEPEAEPEPEADPADIALLKEIRDSLKK